MKDDGRRLGGAGERHVSCGLLKSNRLDCSLCSKKGGRPQNKSLVKEERSPGEGRDHEKRSWKGPLREDIIQRKKGAHRGNRYYKKTRNNRYMLEGTITGVIAKENPGGGGDSGRMYEQRVGNANEQGVLRC